MATDVPAMLSDEQAIQLLERRKRQWSALRDRKIRAQADSGRLRKELEDARRDAAEKFGSDDLDLLRADVVRIRTGNAEALREFGEILDRAEAFLADPEAFLAMATGAP